MGELDYGKINIFLLVDIYILYLFKYLVSLLVSRETWSVNNTIKNQLVSAHCMLVHRVLNYYKVLPSGFRRESAFQCLLPVSFAMLFLVVSLSPVTI